MVTTALAPIDAAALERAPSATSLEQFGEMTIQSLVTRRNKVREVLSKVLEEGVHFGLIPGTGTKPSLYKAGAEVLAMTFGLAPVFQIRRSDLAGGHREYEITCQLRHIATGVLLGEGLGSCSTMESKYRYRRGERKCPTCGAATIMRSKYSDRETNVAGWYCNGNRGGCGAQFPHNAREVVDQQAGRMENPDIADTLNTVLKMAKKRAQVDATLTALGVSDLLTQDLEDMHDAGDDREAAPAKTANESSATKAKSAAAAKPTELRVDPLADKLAEQVITAINDVTTLEELDKLYDAGNRLPKGTTARQRAYDVYQAKLKQLTVSQTHH